MNSELDAIRAACRDHDPGRARELASDYVKDHPDEFTDLAELTVDDLVPRAAAFSSSGDYEQQWRVEAWLLHLGPRDVSGELAMTIDPAGFF